MFLNFDNIDVAVRGSGIISTNASLSSNNNILAGYTLGVTKPMGQFPNGGIKSSFSFTYIPEISQDPNFAVAETIRNLIDRNTYFGEKIEFAGLSNSNFFMDSYSFRIQPNNLVEASATYTTYWETCGELRPKSNLIDYFNQGDLAHSYEVGFLDATDEVLNPVYDIAYEIRANWLPMYILGRKTPIEIKLISVSESLSFTMDESRNILFTGESVYPNIFAGNSGEMEFNNISLFCQNNCGPDSSPYLSLNISGFKIKSITTSATVNEMVRTNYVASRYS